MTCFGRYIGHRQFVHSLIFKASYTICNVFVNKISCTSIKCAFKIITLAVELKSYSEIKDVNSIKKVGCVRMYNLMMADIAAETHRC
jgi:hypothetical protein